MKTALCCAIAASGVVAAATVRADGLATTASMPRDGFELSMSQQTVQTPMASVPLQLPAFQSATQTMLWARRNRWSIGVGVEQRWPTAGDLQGLGATAAQRESQVLVGVALATGERSQLVWQAPLAANGNVGFDPYAAAGGVRESRFGLTMKSSDPLREIRSGMLWRVDLTDQAALAIKPRHGRLALQFDAHW